MNLNFDSQQLAFRDELRAFLRDHLPADIRTRMRDGDHSHIREDISDWQKILHRQGWGAPAWPKEFGGPGWSKPQQYIFDVECALADAPEQLAFGLKMVGPVIMRYGNAEQQQRFLPRIVAADDWWCQGYSEPGSGSDLASLRTRAERAGNDYIVNGQKVWNTLGQFANWIFCLVRTGNGGKPQQGISFLLIDMRTPGVKVQPTRLLDGGFEVNEIWFENVRVPMGNLIGEENRGWTYAKFLLGHERSNVAGIGAIKRELLRLKQIAARTQGETASLLHDPIFATRIAQVEIELRALEIISLRAMFEAERNSAPGPEASILKTRGTEIRQRISELQIDALGEAALTIAPRIDDDTPRAMLDYLNLRKLSIFGGSNEIQRNIIAQRILGL
ncbi:MAG: acyl-CoA dehydrogenase family protein [Proteobacteria bacterium]|nr:acyl-CoA dehydrogenase family protein [Pseudomonadota bacterium]